MLLIIMLIRFYMYSGQVFYVQSGSVYSKTIILGVNVVNNDACTILYA